MVENAREDFAAEGVEAASNTDRLARQTASKNARPLRISEISPSGRAGSISEGMDVLDVTTAKDTSGKC